METVKILIAGDSLIDHHIYKGNRLKSNDFENLGTTIISSFGGFFLLLDILTQTFKSENNIEILSQLSKPDDQHAYAVWGNFDNTWRVKDKMGYGPKPMNFRIKRNIKSLWDGTSCDIAVFDDAAMRFRFDNKAWPKFVFDKQNLPKWILTKMSYPEAQGDFWNYLQDSSIKNRLIVAVSADDLRRRDVKISKGVSWEQTIEDVLKELNSNPTLKNLQQCRHLIINFGSEGALWLIPGESFKDSRGTMVFDPGCMEGEWGKNMSGQIMGGSACFCAGIASSIINHVKSQNEDSTKDINLGSGISSGLSAMRTLYEKGHGKIEGKIPGFPFVDISTVVSASGDSVFRSTLLPGAAFNGSEYWSLIDGNTKDNPGPLYGRARQLALYGPGVLKDIPLWCVMVDLHTLDRSEIESLNGIKQLITDYAKKAKQKKPLSIGVFGPPGAGKSFGIKEIAKGILGKGVSILEFNLSQFSDQKMLIDALHQVRDRVLKGDTPVVFWDEFDSKELMWLQYLLAPMQDGEFLEGQISHPIGKCIFVFAGGTSYTMENFTPIDNEDNQRAIKEFKLKKGPDFVSRLHGYLNVLGPNRRQIFNPDTGKWEDDVADNCFPLRRALLLRVMSGVFDKNRKLDIDFGLLNAFLKIDKYNHGARSMETIIRLTQKEGSTGLFRSSLPPKEQVAIHINFEKFIDLIEQDNLFKLKSVVFSEKIHDFYRKMAKEKGWKVNYDMDYDQLPPHIKSDNIEAALRIPEVLSLISLQIKEKKGDEVEIDANNLHDLVAENIDMLAEVEHDLWTKEKILNGWRLGERNDEKKRHPCLVPYRRLPDHEKEKDKDAVRNYISIIQEAGFNLVYEMPETE